MYALQVLFHRDKPVIPLWSLYDEENFNIRQEYLFLNFNSDYISHKGHRNAMYDAISREEIIAIAQQAVSPHVGFSSSFIPYGCPYLHEDFMLGGPHS